MKKGTKIVLCISGICITLGIILTVIALLFGATLGRFGQYFAYFTNPANPVRPPQQQAYSKSYDGIEELDFELAGGTVHIVDGDTFKIEVSAARGYQPEVKVKNGRWVIADNQQGIVPAIVEDRVVTIYLPVDFTARYMDLEFAAGEIDIDRLTTQALELEIGMGSLTIGELTADTAKLQCGMGNLVVESAGLGSYETECGMGAVTLNLAGSATDYNLNVESGAGDVTVGNEFYGGLATDFHQYNGAPYTLEIECGAGAVTVNFNEFIQEGGTEL